MFDAIPKSFCDLPFLRESQVLKFTAEDLGGRNLHLLSQNRGIDGAEVDGVNQIFCIEMVEFRLLTVQTRLDAATNKHGVAVP